MSDSSQHSPIFASCYVTYIPIFLGGLMKTCNNTPPIAIKNKDKWINKERIRWATQFSIPMRTDTPPGFPPLTLSIQRALAALQIQSPEKLTVAFDHIYAAIWAPPSTPEAQAFDIRVPEMAQKLLSSDSVLGASLAQQILSAATGSEAKTRLSKNTEYAFECGAFGLPYFHCENEKGEIEGFWGFDHLGQVVRFMGLNVEGDAQRGAVRAML